MYPTAQSRQVNKPGPHAPRWPQQTWGPRATSQRHRSAWHASTDSLQSKHRKQAHHEHSVSTATGPITHQTLAPSESHPNRHCAYSKTHLATSHSPSSWPCPLPNHSGRVRVRYIFRSSGLRTASQSQVLNSELPTSPVSSQERELTMNMISTKRIAQLAKKW